MSGGKTGGLNLGNKADIRDKRDLMPVVCEPCWDDIDAGGSRSVEVLKSGFDYKHQAFVKDGRYVACSHTLKAECKCFGTAHAGERVWLDAEVW